MAITDKGDYLEFYERDPTDTRREVNHQIDSFQWLSYAHPYLLAWHTVNENEKSKATAMIDQQSGLVKGVSDFIILIGLNGKYPFAAIEIKRVNKSGKGKASPVSDEQKAFLRRVRSLGGFAAVAYGFNQFKLAIEYMLK
ncbi:putative VRR-NUC domain-containing protein [Escherichia phage vB_EcoD_Poky]|uniref:VRR-NUC domain-containing protein n=1 Tax=Escherichia phage vB_EcoD_Poky TaxID=2902673 RepID=A0AC61TPD5_9CAUD|nr:putative VRR-NUC domain-containing protein [Escherichia phage vB_EcoD_Poky]